MLQCPKSFSKSLSRRFLVGFRIHFQQLRAKSGRPSYKNRYDGDGDDDDNGVGRTRKGKEDQGGHPLPLYKSRGQHLLTNTGILDSIVRNSGVGPNDTVLEIGPGTGNLTLKLLEVANRVVAVEVDNRMVEVLRRRVSECGLEAKLSVICMDALKTDFPDFDLAVANIPYGISSPLVAKLVFGGYKFRSATLLLQKEFASRLLANPGDSEFNRLAVNVTLVADVEHVMNVSKNNFVPSPKVDSSVVKIHLKTRVPDVDLNEWWAFTKTCFGNKNKTLGATFRQKKKVLELMSLSESEWKCSGAGLFKEKLVGTLRTAGLEDKRPSKLSNVELLLLLSLFNEGGVRFHDEAKPRDINASFAA